MKADKSEYFLAYRQTKFQLAEMQIESIEEHGKKQGIEDAQNEIDEAQYDRYDDDEISNY